MIQTALAELVTSSNATIYALATNIALCEHGQGATEEVTTLKVTIDTLRSEIDQLKSTNMYINFLDGEDSKCPRDASGYLQK